MSMTDKELTTVYGGCLYLVFRGYIKLVRFAKLLLRR